ncbi:DUF269 domain-containing protein [Paenibacillus rubinfantis]|uniref:DUF269 domain-containing protein n=1 Tax=Paenibacillus rubinfantis TaxID=1720296 RepID=UPI00073E1C24|nr:DUF269 domain-containing protein [Paenibacillus rubinfantis]
MEETLNAQHEAEQRLLQLFYHSLCGLIDAWDGLGRAARLQPMEKIERLLLFSSEEKQALSRDCRPSPKLRRQVEHVFQAMAVALETETGFLVQSMVEMNEEGFGRAIVCSGRLILVSTTLRAGLRFPFTSRMKLDRFVLSGMQEALVWQSRFKDVAACGE